MHLRVQNMFPSAILFLISFLCVRVSPPLEMQLPQPQGRRRAMPSVEAVVARNGCLAGAT